MSEKQSKEENAGVTLEGGTYEIIRNRLESQGRELRQRLDALNDKRRQIFGSVETVLISNERITTDNNCEAQDIFVIGDHFLFGYNVTLGLKSEMSVADIFAVYEYKDATFVKESLALIDDRGFHGHFHDLFKYYKKARFHKFTLIGPHFYMVFKTSESINDLKVFKWLIDGEKLKYVDDRSVHEYSYPAQHEFEWTRTTRDMHREGAHSHISIEDRVFVETIGGDLTFKVEDNTSDGIGLYREDVEHKDQTLDDAAIYYAILGSLILLKIRPYQEKTWRYFIFNEKMQTVTRVDDIADCCILLPDSHGVIFSKGYYLQSGEYKKFDTAVNDMVFERRVNSPNGEDFLYVFYNRSRAIYVLLSYNLISQSVNTPLICHGYALFHNGQMLYFKSDGEPQKHHAIQLWQTPYCHADFVRPNNEFADHFLFKVGNKDIVSCMAECYEIQTLLGKDDTYAGLYIDIAKKATDVIDSYFWLSEQEAGQLTEPLVQIKQTASSAIDEFEKVVKLKKEASSKTQEVKNKVAQALKDISYAQFDDIGGFVQSLASLRALRGEIIALKDTRYIDVSLLEELETSIKEQVDKLSERCAQFLLLEEALDPYRKLIEDQAKAVKELQKAIEGEEITEKINKTSGQLEMLIEIVSTLKIADATQTTRIIDSISTIFSKLNQVKGALKNKIKDLMSVEGVAEFNAQIKLLNQSIVNYLDVCETPPACDEYLTKIMIQLEELEARFSEFDEFTVQIAEKRDEAYAAFESRKVTIRENLNKRTTSLMMAAERILNGIKNRAQSLQEINDIHSYFAGDLMIDKVRDSVTKLKELGDTVKADDIEGRLKALKEDAVRQLKDKKELYDDDNTIKFGQHKFSVNAQNLDLTIIQKEKAQYFHLTGTNFFEEIDLPQFLETRDVWDMDTVSENNSVYRAEYLAYKFYRELVTNQATVSIDELLQCPEEDFHKHVQAFMAPRYNENYVKGIHDFDAGQILKKLLETSTQVGLLRFSSQARALATLFWHCTAEDAGQKGLQVKIASFGQMRQLFPARKKEEVFIVELKNLIDSFVESNKVFSQDIAFEAAEYLFEEIAAGGEFVISHTGAEICRGFNDHLKNKIFADKFTKAVSSLGGDISGKFALTRNWVDAYIKDCLDAEAQSYCDEAVVLILTDTLRERRVNEVSLSISLEQMSGSHQVIDKGNYKVNFNEFMTRLSRYDNEVVPKYVQYVELKKKLTEEYRQELRLNEFMPRVLSSFVRNRLIDELYLPLIGDNLAKQIGTSGDNKRTDLMGLLLLISPPGYGKTTLMEYVASRLGLIFMKINAPAIGHHVTSLDPSEAPNAAAREEMKKLNLAFEMGDNVMIYLDDIQHSNPEFLQKFISLCDGQRKIEGIYKGRSKTYDFRGRKVVVCMAGNPYTESGDKFQIPDMLANRADTYNLGDIIGDTAAIFNMSYIENALTSNAILSQLVSHSQKDLYSLLKIAETDMRDGIELETSFSVEEMNEFVSVLKKMISVRDIISKVNAEYIKSAATADEYRTEPPFKLQGSYRNMNKMAEKILPVMNDKELKTLVISHYENEAQTLTSGAEFNILRFKELFEVTSQEDRDRLAAIRQTFAKNQLFRGIDEDDPMAQVIVQMGQLTDGLSKIQQSIASGMQAFPELASVLKSTQTPSPLLNLAPEVVDQLKELGHAIAAMTKDTAVGKPSKGTNPDIIPDQIKIINTVPDFFATILKDQLELMRTWMGSIHDIGNKNNDQLKALAATIKEVQSNYDLILSHVESSSNEPSHP